MGNFDPMSMPYDDMPEDAQLWLRDQHPRGAAVIEANKAKFSTAEVVESESDVPPYEKWSARELAAEAEARKLDSKGNKDTLVARLYENDRAAGQS